MARIISWLPAAAMFVSSVATVGQDRPATQASEAPPAATLELRRRFMDPSVNALTFHTIDSIFNTQRVARGGRVLPLPRAERPLGFTYDFAGKTLPAESVLERTYTNSLLILKDGRIVYERYRNHTSPQTKFLSMSMAKSITSILVGIALDEGSIRSLDDQIITYVPELRGSAYDGVTIRNAIDMKTGVDRSDGDQLKPGSTGAAMREQVLIRNLRPAAEEALLVKRKAPPGGSFDYSTLNTTVLGWVLEKATRQPLLNYTSDKLWSRLGAEADAFWMMSGTGPATRPFNGLGFNATLRDYGRLGMMMLNDGKVGRTQIVSKKWVDESVGGQHVPTSPGSSTGYKHFWWTVPGSSAYMAVGLQGQYIYVDPASRTVVVKLSYEPLSNREAGNEARAFFAAASQWQPE
jgi:CubicO group peptidase (beta-lactamase class C family)